MIALCDADLIGKKLEEDIRELDCRENFFKERELTQEEAITLIQTNAREDATFNIVGHESIKAAQAAGLIGTDDVITIQGVPFTLVLL